MIKKFFILELLALILGAMAYGGTGINGVIARQRFPWNGKVDITYNVQGDIAAASADTGCFIVLVVKAIDRNTGIEYTATKLSGDTALTEGRHTIVWDMEAQGIKLDSDKVGISVSVMANPKYCLIDVSSGQYSENYPVTYLMEEPEDGFLSDYAYRRSILVLKLVPPGTFIMGSDQDDETHRVTLTKPFFMGLFPMTQNQYNAVMGNNPSYNCGDMYPVERVAYNILRGTNLGTKWPESSEVDSDSLIGKLRKRTQNLLKLDVPTEAQWEYVCRAGTITAFSCGPSYNSQYANCGTWSVEITGTRLPNPWGFYDMHGNTYDWCLDWYSETSSYGVDPVGPATGTERSIRGGDSWLEAYKAYSYAREGHSVAGGMDGYELVGVRLVINQ